MSPIVNEVGYGVEGVTDATFAESMIRAVGREPRPYSAGGGKSVLDRKVRRWNQRSNGRSLLVLRDWDDDDKASCPGELVTRVTGSAPLEAPAMLLRVAVRAIESWAIADLEGAARFFGVAVGALPRAPDELTDPKSKLVALCRRSRRPTIKRGMIPTEGSGARVGPLFVPLLSEFACKVWQPERAAKASPSLARALARMGEMVADGRW